MSLQRINLEKSVPAVVLIQRVMRGCLTRKRISAWRDSALIIQKNIRMWIVRRRFGRNREDNAFREWFKAYDLRRRITRFHKSIIKLQAHVRKALAANKYMLMRYSVVKIQALWRGVLGRKSMATKQEMALKIQANWRQHFYGRVYMQRMHLAATAIQARVRGIQVRGHMTHVLLSTVRVQASMRGALARREVHLRIRSATSLQTWWRRYLAIITVKKELASEVQSCAKRYDDIIKLKSMGYAAVEIQRLCKGHRARVQYIKLLESRQLHARTCANVSAIVWLGLNQVHQPFHPWVRYLPQDLRDRFTLLKGIIQRAIVASGDPVCECIAHTVLKDAIGKCGVMDVKSCIAWVSQTLTHGSVKIASNCDVGVRRINVQPQGPSRAEDPIMEFHTYVTKHKTVLDRIVSVENSNFGLHVASEVSLLSSLLVTYREFLNQPRLKPESNLAFQGMDPSASAQALDIIASELGVTLRVLSWSSSVSKSTVASAHKLITDFLKSGISAPEQDEKSMRSKFQYLTREQVARSVQRLGILARGSGSDLTRWEKHGKEVQSLLSDGHEHVKQEHYGYILSVAFSHVVIRAMLMREVSARAALTVQTAYRYYKTRTVMRRIKGPVLTIQRYWRGLKASLDIARQDRAARLIQANVRIWMRQGRNQQLLHAVKTIQRFARGTIQRRYLSLAQKSAIRIQKLFRGHFVRLVLGSKESRAVRAAFRSKLHMLAGPVRIRAVSLEYRAALEDLKAKALGAKRSRAKHAQRKLDQYRKAIQAIQKGSGGGKRIVRESVFEPPVFAQRRIRYRMMISAHPQAKSGSLVPAAQRLMAQLAARVA